ncbi:hypothetical protein ACS0TY_027319 [Phlomoides rotata]
MKRLMQELVMERSTGASFLQSEAGRRHIVTLKRQAAKSGVDDFKESPAFKEIMMNRSMSVYDDVVKECQRLLRKSGRVSEDVIKLFDAVDSDQDEGDGEKADSKKLRQELDVERSTGSFFLKSEVGRCYIVTLQRQAAKSGVEEFKETPAFKEIVMNRAMSVYDDVVKECQRLLRESGRVSDDIVQLLDHPQDSDLGEAHEHEAKLLGFCKNKQLESREPSQGITRKRPKKAQR